MNLPDTRTAFEVTHLHLRDFRNYPRLDLPLGSGIHIFLGSNGTGKTNLLEAISYVSLGRSPRTSRDSDLVRTGSTGFEVEVAYRRAPAGASNSPSSSSAAVHFTPSRGSRALLDGKAAANLAELYGRVPSVFFSPDDLWLLKGPPSGRRHLVDRLLAQSSPLYADAHLRYRHALAQRNAALRQVRARHGPQDLLAIWEPLLLQYGEEIFTRRAAAVAALATLAAEAYAHLSGGAEQLECRYVPGLPGPTASSDRWRERFQIALEARRGTDVALAATSVGPQRDDIEVLLAGRAASRFASQGQQRSAVLALKFAERTHLRHQTGAWPLLLVDDVLSELDRRRRQALAETLCGEGQVFLTSTDPAPLNQVMPGNRYLVAGGRIVPLPG